VSKAMRDTAKNSSAACEHELVSMTATNQGYRMTCIDCGVVGPEVKYSGLTTECSISVRDMAQTLGIPVEAAHALAKASLRSS
jgi:hypothetical protein